MPHVSDDGIRTTIYIPRSQEALWNEARQAARSNRTPLVTFLMECYSSAYGHGRKKANEATLGVRYPQEIGIDEAIELGRLMERVEAAFRHGNEAQLDKAAIADWAISHPLAAKRLYAELVWQPYGARFSSWWKGLLGERAQGAGR